MSSELDNIFLEHIIDSLNCGVFAVDDQDTIKVWNNFMASHSGKPPEEVIGKNVFELFPELPQSWLKKKLKSVFILKNFAFTTWEQRPYLFKFYHNRPATSIVDDMRQNCTFIPIKNSAGEVKYVCVTIQDVTDTSIFQLLLAESKKEIEQQSRIDGLTGIYNRKYWEEALRHEVKRVKRYESSLSVVMLDLDHFKKINDTLGHLAGDEVIRSAAKIVSDCLRECDIAGRYGGEEFGAILCDTDEDGALKTAERIRSAMETAEIVYNGERIPVTVSIGVATLKSELENVDKLVDHADQALYMSKKAGRNRVSLYQETTTEPAIS